MDVILNQFAGICRDQPHRPLLHLPATNTTQTAAQLMDAGRAFRDALDQANVRAGGLVLSAIGNRADAIPLLLACWQTGAAILPVDAGTTADEIFSLAERFCASAVVLPSAAADGRSVRERRLSSGLSIIPWEAVAPSSYGGLAILKLTSGSTGVPKAVVTTEPELLADTDHIVTAMGIAPDDVQLAVIPLSHAYGFGNLVMPMLLQGTAIVLRESFVPQQLLADARSHRARIFHGVPFMFQHYLVNPPADGWPAPLSLLISAGARLEPATIRQFHQRFGVKIHSFYGTSESGGIAFDDGAEIDDRSTVGRPLPGVTIELRRGEGVPSGEGRIHVSSTAVSRRYTDDICNDELSGGGFLTGDYGHFTPGGRLVLAGRVSTFINVAGRKVQPGEVERVLREIDGVSDARVLAATDVSRGEQIAAVVATRSGLTLAAVRTHCARRLASYKIPRLVILVEELPLTARGKVDFDAIRALVDGRGAVSA